MFPEFLRTWWASVWQTDAPIDTSWHVWIASLVAVAIATPQIWSVIRHVITIAHEAGHAVVGVLVGRKLKGISLHADTSGVTTSTGRARGLGMIVTAFAGYPAPAVAGLIAAGLVASGHSIAVLWWWLVGLVLILPWIRNWFGLLPVVFAGAGIGFVLWQDEPPVPTVVALALTWLLLLGAIRPVWEMQRERSRARRRGRRSTSDADVLASLTWFPGGFWVAVMLLVIVALAALGSWWMVLGAIQWPW